MPKPQIKQYITYLQNAFGPRLVAVIGYGSFFSRPSDREDIDLVIALNKHRNGDIDIIRKAQRRIIPTVVTSPFVTYTPRINNDGNFFSINTCGPFFLKTIQNGKVLYGKNPYATITDHDEIMSDISVLQKIQQYNYQLKTCYLNLTNDLVSQKIARLFKKRLRFLAQDLRLLQGISKRDCLSAGDVKNIRTITDKKKTTQADLIRVIDLSEHIYGLAAEYCQKKYQTYD